MSDRSPEVPDFPPQPVTGAGAPSEAGSKVEEKAKGDDRSQQEIDQDNALAERLSSIIENANQRVVPICEMIRKVSRMSNVLRIRYVNVRVAYREYGSSEGGRTR